MMMNVMVICVGAVGYWLVGFAFQSAASTWPIPRYGGRRDSRRMGAFSDRAGRVGGCSLIPSDWGNGVSLKKQASCS